MPMMNHGRRARWIEDRRGGRRRLLGLVAAMVLAGVTPAAAQESDISAVRDVAQAYLDGILLADTAMLAQAFHPDVRFFGAPGRALEILPVDEWIASRAGVRLEPASDYTHRVVSVDVAGDAASAKVELIWPSNRFVDYLSFLRIGGEWKIVGKIWHQEPSARAMAGIETRPLAAGEAGRYVGRYSTGSNEFEVVDRGSELRIRIGSQEYRLFYQGDATFVPEWDTTDRLRFIVEGGRAAEVEIRQENATAIAKRTRR